MVSHHARHRTIRPSNYQVLYDESGLDADKIQMLSFKMTHLYYNSSGTVAVPAVCQYASKLAHLSGVSLKEKAHSNLDDTLWYL